MQLPFLQFVNKDNLNKIRIVPIVVGKDVNYEKLGKAIAETAKELRKRVVLICSSDFTHYGVSYGYVPFRGHIAERFKDFDLAAIKWIKDLDSWSFVNYVEDVDLELCP